MNRSIAAITLLGAATVVHAQDPGRTLIYVPAFEIGFQQNPAEGDYFSWVSTIAAVNSASTASSIQFVPTLGSSTIPCGGQDLVYGPGDGNSPSCMSGSGPVHFVAAHMGAGMTITASVNRVVHRTRDLCTSRYPLGRTPLPVYTRLLPAGQTAVAGPIKAVDRTVSGCLPPAEQRNIPYRVSLTLWNASERTSTIRVAARGLRRAETLYSLAVDLAGGETRQVGLPLAALPYNDGATDGLSASLYWIDVISDTTFLGYVSSITDEGEPFANTMEVLPFTASK